VAEVLSRFAPQGVVIEAGPEGIGPGEVTVYAYLRKDEHIQRTRRRVEEALWHLGQISPLPEPSFRSVAESDWAEEWKKNLRVLQVGQRIVIRPSWLSYRPTGDQVVIDLDPGMAFGTGLHPTTQMCLIALEKWVRPETTLLDLGTGSGILAIAGAKLGATSVLALDNDPQAARIARQNVHLNKVGQRVQVDTGSLSQAGGTYDLVVVNIVAKVLTTMIQSGLAERLSQESVLILTGIIDDQEKEILSALEHVGLVCVGRQQVDDWVALEAQPAS